MAKKRVKASSKDMHRIRLAVLVVLLLVILAFFLVNKGEFGRKSNLVGDRICGSYSSPEERNLCCTNTHAGDVVVACVGEWTFNIEGFCEFVCTEENVQIGVCEEQGGEWKTFSNGCVDSCALARNPEVILCSQAQTDGCDCGIDRCWNGESCEDN